MITIIHGDDISASRSYLSLLKASVTDPITLIGDSIDITELTQILSGGGLFEDPKFLNIEQLLSNKKSLDTKTIIELLTQHSETHNIVIWENKELTKPTLNKFPKASVKQFKLPQTLFQLMDSLRPDNTKQILSLYHTTSERVEDELILYMLARQIRILLAIKSNSMISEIRAATWQMSKLRQQANNFSTKQLKILHNEIYEIDYQLKTGSGVFNITTLIDNLLFKI